VKLYFLCPPEDINKDDMRLYCAAVVALIENALRPDQDSSLIGVWRVGELGMGQVAFSHAYEDTRIVSLGNRTALRRALERCADESEAHHMWVRSQATCRSAFFIGDGKAYLCLATLDPPPISDVALIRISECSHTLIETDFLDGAVEP
jgi:hypothetical protein